MIPIAVSSPIRRHVLIAAVAIAGIAIATNSFGQSLVFPPELYWWISEVQKANPTVALSKFTFDGTATEDMENVRLNTDFVYPVFKRWNYSGDWYAYTAAGTSLSKERDGRYTPSFDVDSGLFIIDRNGMAVFQEGFGSSAGINAVAWLRDRVLVAVGVDIIQKASGGAVVDLFVRVYRFGPRQAEIDHYSYPAAFDNDMRSGLHLDWWEQRSDYFVVK